jgi:hypothetical protein
MELELLSAEMAADPEFAAEGERLALARMAVGERRPAQTRWTTRGRLIPAGSRPSWRALSTASARPLAFSLR